MGGPCYSTLVPLGFPWVVISRYTKNNYLLIIMITTRGGSCKSLGLQYCTIARGGGGHSENFLTGVCRWGFKNHTLTYGELRPKTDPCLRRSGSKSMYFDRKVNESLDFWPNFSDFSSKSGEKSPKFGHKSRL